MRSCEMQWLFSSVVLNSNFLSSTGVLIIISFSRLSMSCFLDMKPCRFSFCRCTFYAFCKTTLINTPPAPAAAIFMFRIFIHHMFVPFSPVCITFLAKFDTSDLRLNSVGGNSVGAYLKNPTIVSPNGKCLMHAVSKNNFCNSTKEEQIITSLKVKV